MSIWEVFNDIGNAVVEGAESTTKGVGDVISGDAFYPDNPKREDRVKELADDCKRLTSDLSNLFRTLDTQLQSFNAGLTSLSVDVHELKAVNLDYGGKDFEVASLIIPLLAGQVVSSSLTVAATSSLLASGEIGAAALVEVAGLPSAFAAGVGIATGAAAIVAIVGVGAIAGDMKRSKLQSTIRQAYSGRQQLQKAYLVNVLVSKSISVLNESLQTLQNLKDKEGNQIYSTEKIMEILKGQVRKLAEQVSEASSDISAQATLKALDEGRHSWTNED